jgi:hypothetical protein
MVLELTQNLSDEQPCMCSHQLPVHSLDMPALVPGAQYFRNAVHAATGAVYM